MWRASILALMLGCVAGGQAAAGESASSLQALNAAAFAVPAPPSDDPVGSLLDHDQQAYLGPGYLPYRPGAAPQAYELSLTRRFGNVEFAPHAGLGFDRFGSGSAEAGATVRLSAADIAANRLRALGVTDGARFGDQGRWYLFAAASGRAVGLNMLHGETGGWNRAGWTTDPTSKLVGDAQVGIGWRKGAIESSIGFVHREVKGEHLLMGVDPKADSMIAFSFAIKPH